MPKKYSMKKQEPSKPGQLQSEKSEATLIFEKSGVPASQGKHRYWEFGGWYTNSLLGDTPRDKWSLEDATELVLRNIRMSMCHYDNPR